MHDGASNDEGSGVFQGRHRRTLVSFYSGFFGRFLLTFLELRGHLRNISQEKDEVFFPIPKRVF
jgi:hypothetical protein